jgi:septal ring factor EnvC (AmiA/AmiB activator)
VCHYSEGVGWSFHAAIQQACLFFAAIDTFPPFPLPVCRADNEHAQKHIRDLQGRVRAAEAQLSPLQQRIRVLEAERDSAAQELATVKEEADRWSKRARQLMQRYESVDQQEHQLVGGSFPKLSHSLSCCQDLSIFHYCFITVQADSLTGVALILP